MQDINPLPYPMTVVNGAGWVAYGFAIANPYIFPANVVGFLAGVFFTFTAFACAPKQVRREQGPGKEAGGVERGRAHGGV